MTLFFNAKTGASAKSRVVNRRKSKAWVFYNKELILLSPSQFVNYHCHGASAVLCIAIGSVQLSITVRL